MGLKLNKFSSRVLDVRNHSIYEVVAVQLFFLAILYALISAGYKSATGQVVMLYFGAAAVVVIALLIDLYFIFSNYFLNLGAKNEKPKNEQEP